MARPELIPGLFIEKPANGGPKGSWPYTAHVVSDKRGAPDHAVTRIAYHFPALDRHPWASKLRERLKILSSFPFRHVQCPLERGVTADGGMYILFEETFPLSSSAKVNPAELWDIFQQAAKGLAELHDRGLTHGSIARENLVRSGDQRVLLAGAAWGQLLEWSGGEFVSSDAVKYLRSRVETQLKPSSVSTPRDDVYALGQAIRMLAANEAEPFDSKAKNSLLDSLSAETGAPQNGGHLCEMMSRIIPDRPWAFRNTVFGVAVFALAATLFAVWCWNDRNQFRQLLTEEKAHHQKSREEVEQLQTKLAMRPEPLAAIEPPHQPPPGNILNKELKSRELEELTDAIIQYWATQDKVTYEYVKKRISNYPEQFSFTAAVCN